MKNLIIQSNFQKNYLKDVLKEKIDYIIFIISGFENCNKLEEIDLENLENLVNKKLELQNLLDQLNRMGDFI